MEIGSLFEKIVKKLPEFGEGNRNAGPGSAESPKQDGYKEAHCKTHHNEVPKVKDRERILKAAREKHLVTYREVPIRLSVDFSKQTLQARRDWQEIFKVMKCGTYRQDCYTQQSYHLESKGR